MATVTVYTAARMKQIEDSAVVNGEVVGGELLLERYDGGIINAGSVIGPMGPQGPTGEVSDAELAAAVSALEAVDTALDGRLDTAESDITAIEAAIAALPQGVVHEETVGGSSGITDNTRFGPYSFAFVNGRKYRIDAFMPNVWGTPNTWEFSFELNNTEVHASRFVCATGTGISGHAMPPYFFTASSHTSFGVSLDRITGSSETLNFAVLNTTPALKFTITDLGEA